MKFLIWGYYGYRNTGDEMMLSIIIDILRKIDDKCQITVKTKSPAETREKYGVETLYENATIRKTISEKYDVFKKIIQANVLLIGGGTLLHEYPGAGWRSIFRLLKIAILAKVFGTKVVLYGVGVGEILTRTGIIFTRHLVNNSALTVVRDNRSKRILADIGCRSIKVRATADLTFMLYDKKIHRESKTGINKKMRIGVSVLPFYDYLYQDHIANEEMAIVLAKSLDRLVEMHGAEIYFITMQDDLRISDREYAKLIVEYMDHQRHAYIIDYQPNFVNTYHLFSTMDGAIIMRLHALILAMLNKVPVVALSYNPKVSALMQEAKLNNQIIEIQEINIDRILNCFTMAHMTRDNYNKSIEEKLCIWDKLSEKSIEYLIKAIEV